MDLVGSNVIATTFSQIIINSKIASGHFLKQPSPDIHINSCKGIQFVWVQTATMQIDPERDFINPETWL